MMQQEGIKIEFDKPDDILSGEQLCLFDSSSSLQLPPIDTDLIKDVKKRKRKKPNYKDKAANIISSSGNASIICSNQSVTLNKPSQLNISDIKVIEDKDKPSINIDSIQLAKENIKYKELAVKRIEISGSNNSKNDIVNIVSSKVKQDITDRNKELLQMKRHPYKKKGCILTDAEKKCYKFLKSRIGKDIVLLSKVRLADVVELNELITRDSKEFFKIAYKHLDYIILSPDLDLICAVELDDYTHDTEKGKERDRFIEEVLQDCGIPLFRIKQRVDRLSSEDTKRIEYCILEYMAPTCPMCGRPMELKISGSKKNYGHRFYGCMGWYESGMNRCGYTVDID